MPKQSAVAYECLIIGEDEGNCHQHILSATDAAWDNNMGEFAEKYCRRMNIAGVFVSSNVFMAPMAGCTNVSFRLLVERLGAGLAFTEMVYVEDLISGKRRALDSVRTDEREPIRAIQLIGGDPAAFQHLFERHILDPVDWIDINMGCAVPDITKKGRGCVLVHDLQRASAIIKACKNSGKVVSVKCRPGMDLKQDWITPFAKMCEDSGADLLTVHGRPGCRQHEGPVVYETIASAKSCVHIPVIGNGGIFSEEDAVLMMKKTGADGIMIGRYGLQNPDIFSILTGR